MVCCQTLVWLATISLAQLPPLPPLSGPASWTPPIGVPTPPFGINQQVPSRPNPWTATMAGWYYVDTFAPGATDSSNPNGYPGRPRRTIPGSLPAGSVVEVHGIYDDGGEQFITASGTATNPVYIRGQSSTQMPLITTKLRMSGRYLICENLEIGDRDGILSGGQVGKFTFLDGSDHIVFRRNDIHGNLLEGGIGVSGDYHVIWDNLIHDNGDWQTDFDQDCHGVVVGDDTAHLWIVDNELYRNSGDGVQVNAAARPARPAPIIFTLGGTWLGRTSRWDSG